MATLCVVDINNKLINIPLVDDNNETIYDSCAYGTHSIIPPFDECMYQWQRYLGDDAPIFKAGSRKLIEEIPNQLVQVGRGVQSFCQACIDQDLNQAYSMFDNIKNNIDSYYNIIKKKIISLGWHSEQRIIYELDGQKIRDQLKNIDNIKMLIVCLHSRLAPCIAKQYTEGGNNSGCTCDCYNTLKSWTNSGKLQEDFSTIPVLMTVSYSEYSSQSPESIYTSLLNESNKFFMIRIQNQTILEDTQLIESGKRWLNNGKCFNTINSFKFKPAIISSFEMNLENLFNDFIHTYNLNYKGENLSMTFDSVTLKRNQIPNAHILWDISPFYNISGVVFNLSNSDNEDPIELKFELDDSDWTLLLKFHLMMSFATINKS